MHQHAQPPLICILAGQSDMVGRGEPEKLSEEFASFVAGGGDRKHSISVLYEIDFLGREGASSDSGGEFRPLNKTAQFSNAGDRYSFGPEWGIADAILRSDCATNNWQDIYFIKFAAGSTNLHEDWAPGGELFPRLISLVKHGVKMAAERCCHNANRSKHDDEDQADNKSAQIVEVEEMERSLMQNQTAFFWLQGHGDAGGKAIMRSNYADNFGKFCKSLRENLLGISNTENKDISKCNDSKNKPSFSSVPENLNLPIIASEYGCLVNPNSKSSVRFAKRLKEVNLALRETCETLAGGREKQHRMSLADSKKNDCNTGDVSDPIPCLFASFPFEDNTFHLSYHADGHYDNNGLLSLGRNMGYNFCECFLSEQSQKT